MFWNNVLQVAIEDRNDIIRRRSWFPTFGPISHILPGAHLLRCCPAYTRAHFSDTVVAPYQVGFSVISPNSVALKTSTTVTLRWHLTIQWHCDGILLYSTVARFKKSGTPNNVAQNCCKKMLPKNLAHNDFAQKCSPIMLPWAPKTKMCWHYGCSKEGCSGMHPLIMLPYNVACRLNRNGLVTSWLTHLSHGGFAAAF